MAETKEKMPDKGGALPSQKFIEIKGVQGNTLLLKSGGLRQILMISGINFDLKSEDEQEMIIGSFQSFLNSLDFSIQIFIHSRKLNVDNYLERLVLRESEEENGLLKNQISEYREFIKSFVGENAIMAKNYFVVVPYDPIQLSGGGEAITDKIFGVLKKKGIGKPTERLPESGESDEKQLSRHIEQITHRVDQVVSGLNQIGLRAVSLNGDELLDLFYNLYNPSVVERRNAIENE
ncbi:MAG: hypothetical protein COU07_03775 [Candidatus Harrisonbacteria bacterium CG10_big_fil_rev_8_21_14_0_10_40_38]|uniref:TraC-like domain-containing protein n=1 Tax=Candidatus Harrisonbacteria bacterium CG10_big_fil_rev_8_21_14_0_10_40_38 TaxID=1974583 RepID=A0A2H0URG2_9BACT|nr:MAG: hypothetical protein COU07_03775 [Candidatus Harrisonbacteria bacterium CG10_big_fil_rev_8_21_14_0_10_40_38]